MKHFKARVATLLLALLLLLSCQVGCERQRKYSDSSFSYFDTYAEITVCTGDRAEAEAFFARVWGMLEEFHRLYDIYEEYDGLVNLKVINDRAGISPVRVDGRILDLLSLAVGIGEKTDGQLNIAMGSLLSVWHSYRESGTALPSDGELADAGAHTSLTSVVIDRDAGTVYFSDPALKLDVGAIAKGYATEQVAKVLIADGYTDFCLNIGGNVRTVGTKPDGSPWRIGVQDPVGKTDYLCVVPVTDAALVTSGSYQRYYEVEGVRYHHILDPDTRYPAAYFDSVTVRCSDAAVADALSTALFCMSREDGLALLDRFPGVEVLWVGTDGAQYRTDGFSNE